MYLINGTCIGESVQRSGHGRLRGAVVCATTLKDLKEHQVLARRVADELAAGAQVLKWPRPGYFAIELAKLGRDVTF